MVRGRRKFSGKTKTTHTTSKVNSASNTRNLKTVIPPKNETYSMSNYSGVNKGFGSGSSSVGGFVGPGIPEVNAEPSPVDTPTTTGLAYGGSIENVMTSETPESTHNPTPGTYSEPPGKEIFSHDVYFKNLYGKGANTKVPIKTKIKNISDKQLQILAAMELQKEEGYLSTMNSMGMGESYTHDKKIKKINLGIDDKNKRLRVNSERHHGDVFKHLSNKSGDYITLSEKKRDPTNKNYMWDKRAIDYKPLTYGDRGLTGIGRISATGFAGGKRGDDPFKFTQPKKRGFKVIPDSGVPQWAKFKDDAIKTKAQYNDQFTRNDESKGVNIVNGRRVVGGSQKIRDSMDLFGGQDIPILDSIDLGKVRNFANPDYLAAQEAGKKRSAEAAKKREISLLEQYSEENLSGNKF